MSQLRNFRMDDIGKMTFTSAEDARRIMMQVYAWMTVGLLITSGVAFATIQSGIIDDIPPLVYFGALILELVLVFWLSMRVMKMAPMQAAVLFLAYSALNGFTISMILMAYTAASVTGAFVSAAALFGAMSIYGATTNADLTRWRTFLMMGLIGLILAMIINIFLGSDTMDFIISIFGVLIFTALTAYDTQRIGRMARCPELTRDQNMVTRVSIIGALALYLDFINLFLFLLRLIGNRR